VSFDPAAPAVVFQAGNWLELASQAPQDG
jgi:hypothetical protein